MSPKKCFFRRKRVNFFHKNWTKTAIRDKLLEYEFGGPICAGISCIVHDNATSGFWTDLFCVDFCFFAEVFEFFGCKDVLDYGGLYTIGRLYGLFFADYFHINRTRIMPTFLQDPKTQMIFSIAFIAILVVIVYYIAMKLRNAHRTDDFLSPDDMLGIYAELYNAGKMTEDEYTAVKKYLVPLIQKGIGWNDVSGQSFSSDENSLASVLSLAKKEFEKTKSQENSASEEKFENTEVSQFSETEKNE